MYYVRVFDKIASQGLRLLKPNEFRFVEDGTDADAVLVRSKNLLDVPLEPRLQAIARAGVGFNNIPVEQCSRKGVVVFNTPGGNANSVKELVIAALLLSSRRIVEGINWTRALAQQDGDIVSIVEQRKSDFAGPEIAGKRLGVVGLGAVGVTVANAAVGLDMEVIGYDPFISINSAWGLSRSVRRAENLSEIFGAADYITLHLPLNANTANIIDAAAFARMKPTVRLLNFSRGGLIDSEIILQAAANNQLALYVTDFPEQKLAGHPKVVAVPHLGASTPEAEQNCAIMAVNQIKGFLKNGVIVNSVNFPECRIEPSTSYRLSIANYNIPNMVGQITAVMAAENCNIQELTNRHRGEFAYTIIDIDGPLSEQSLERIRAVDGIITARLIETRPRR